MTNLKEMIGVRDEYIRLIRTELLGPGSEVSIPDVEHEIISSAPQNRYSIGILYPQDNKVNTENDESLRVEEESNIVEEDDDIVLEEEPDDNKSYKKQLNDGEEENNMDDEIGLASQNLPSSMGITFFIRENVDKLVCKIDFATYSSAKVSDCRIPFSPDNPESYIVPDELSNMIYYNKENSCLKLVRKIVKKEVRDFKEKDILVNEEYGIINCLYKLCDQIRMGYVREPHSITVTLDFSEDNYIDNNRRLEGTFLKVTALKRKVSDELFSITIMIVNDLMSKPSGSNCIFQPVITVESNYNNISFCEYAGEKDNSYLDEEEQGLELLYRNKKVYGTGMGTALSWKIDEQGKGKLYSDSFPEAEVPPVDFKLAGKYNVPEQIFSMKYLSDLDGTNKKDKVGSLKLLVQSYERWIVDLEKNAANLHEKYKNAALRNIKNCKSCSERMNNGIKTLENSSEAWDAFILSNRAMFMQRIHLDIQNKIYPGDHYPEDIGLAEIINKINYCDWEDKYFWRPFQLAFQLMSINSIVYDESKDRELLDLIWFPTGGGKTEAYLGLSAFTIFYRRLKNANVSAGTTVIMRYTLRLLTAQQFTRASTLICACEYIRTDGQSRKPKYKMYDLGKEEISIGLWIGVAHTPNKIKGTKDYPGAANYLEKLTSNIGVSDLRYKKDRYNKFQLLKCPWCGTKMVKDVVKNKMVGAWGYKLKNNSRFYMSCPQEACDFYRKLPIQIVDEELYKSPPTLLFGTVDKFAMLPWRSEIGSFFASEDEMRSPELIIQDELHLISGPLGTIVGLYETAIDAICSKKGVKPKIIASTATIRRAKEQCAALYNREVNQFPSPGLDASDSFFSRESNISYKDGVFGRKYIGLMPSGKTKAMMEVRSISAMLQKINTMELDDEIKDKYWTLTVYFNSLKDLGKCTTLVEDDVKDFIKRMAYRIGTAKDGRIIMRPDELTSRVSTSELNETLDKIEKLNYSSENIKNKRYASNVLLATNMISVGIDVARLNVMLLVGQPKLTSEYIQASSRIGRLFPGVAFAMYDSSKSRDRSHFEQFKSYHESFYKYVEPTGVTPYAKPARDRALHAVAIAMIRHFNTDLLEDICAGKFDKEKYKDTVSKVENLIINRNTEIRNKQGQKLKDNTSDILDEMEQFFDLWENMKETYGEDNLWYGEKFMIKPPNNEQGRLMKVFNTNKYDPAIDTMTSMRNVDNSVAGNVLIWEEKK